MSDGDSRGRVIELRKGIIGPPPPREKKVRPRPIEDFRHLGEAYQDLLRKYSSPTMLGPPVCDELAALLQHVFSEEEASAARHLGLFRGHTAQDVARAEHRPVEQVEPHLRGLADEKRVIAASGPAAARVYRLLPIMPGMFEMTLVNYSVDELTPWHRRFIELFEALYETGYIMDYGRRRGSPGFRFLPVHRVIEAHPMALPTDRLDMILERFDTFAVGKCQCRTAMAAQGRGCGGPVQNCAVMGHWAKHAIAAGGAREVSRKQLLEIKLEAEAQGMVNWLMNVENTKSQVSCSCCGCCCHAMRAVSEFNAPGIIAPPHFVPRLDESKCTFCGRCAKKCPMGALIVDVQGKTHRRLGERCVGCGQCLLACEPQRALSMVPAPEYRPPYRSWFSFIAHAAPGFFATSWQVQRQRK